eukprot:NODE_1870_length_480_cov_88.679814_g1792_i0.p2 GENE.NODE_1870_length_480_cov_88.679814_g1792_i0~~NODE_1870_length_480_cov_88.679814_g1792_i0.p2  ORF type:complete len:53 (-),score=8.63 NODE_1870_length_480_cov_88.679814_g1792_i0:47-205(-)
MFCSYVCVGQWALFCFVLICTCLFPTLDPFSLFSHCTPKNLSATFQCMYNIR